MLLYCTNCQNQVYDDELQYIKEEYTAGYYGCPRCKAYGEDLISYYAYIQSCLEEEDDENDD